jgi:hypothetical protein
MKERERESTKEKLKVHSKLIKVSSNLLLE